MRTYAIIFALSIFSISAMAQTRLVDDKIKKDVTPMSSTLAQVKMLEPVTYQYDNIQYKSLKLPEGTQYGFTTASVQQAFPELVQTTSKFVPAGKNAFRTTEIKNVDMESLIPVLLSAVQEQQKQIDSLKEQLKAMKK
jgi:hypothetical protein